MYTSDEELNYTRGEELKTELHEELNYTRGTD